MMHLRSGYMRPILALAVLVLGILPLHLNAQSPARPVQPQVSADRPDWENPAVYAIGKEPARATAFPFESRAKAIAGHRTQSHRFLSLNGMWRFSFTPNADRLPAG